MDNWPFPPYEPTQDRRAVDELIELERQRRQQEAREYRRDADAEALL